MSTYEKEHQYIDHSRYYHNPLKLIFLINHDFQNQQRYLMQEKNDWMNFSLMTQAEANQLPYSIQGVITINLFLLIFNMHKT